MSATRTPPTRVIDAACLIVVAATIGMYVVTQHAGFEESTARIIVTIAVAKSVVISAAFMGLLWTSRVLLSALICSYVLLGVLLVAILT